MRFDARSRFLASLSLVLVAACHGGESTGPSGPPVVNDVNGATLPAGPVGSTVIIEGSNFGNSQGSSQVLFTSSTGTVPASIASPSNWSSTFIVTTVPAGTVNGNVVVKTAAGTSSPVVFTVTSGAAFSPSTVTWTPTSQLPVALSGHAAAFAEVGSPVTRVVYAIGGEDNSSTPQSAVYYTTVGAGGSLGTWSTTAALPAAIAFHRALVATPANSKVSATGYVYVLGGASDAAGTQASSAIYRGTINSNGTISGWTSAGTLPAPLHSFGAAIFLGNIYIWGGATTNNAPVATSYRTTIDASGNIGAWKAEASLPSGRAYFEYGSFGGFLYSLGGNTGTIAPNDASTTSSTMTSEVLFAQIDLRSRDLAATGWTLNASAMSKSRMKHSGVVAGGNILVTGGLYAGAATGSSEESYAQLNPDGSTGSFNGATGANTISSAGGGNLFNQSSVGYVDAAGAFHVAVVGGDDVNNPGTRHKTVFFY